MAVAETILTVSGSTITNNTGPSGGILAAGALNAFRLGSSIVAGNQNNKDVTGTITQSLGGNFVGNGSGASGFSGEDLRGTSTSPLDARLGALADYGGLTPTMLPYPDSPVIDAVASMGYPTDQRGLPRIDGSAADVGAAEYQGTTDSVYFWDYDGDGDGFSLGLEQALGTDPFSADPSHPANPSFFFDGTGMLTFGRSQTAVPGTQWIVTRSIDLTPGSWVELYRFDGSSDFPQPGISFDHTASNIRVTDNAPPAEQAFYRLEIEYAPLP